MGAFREDCVHCCGVKVWRKASPVRILHAVIGPEDLCDAMQLDQFAGAFAGVSRCKAAVICGVPILSRNHDLEMRHRCVGDGDDLVAARDPQCAPREKVVLYINDEQSGFHVRYSVWSSERSR